MSSGLDNLSDLLDDPGYKAWARGGGGGRAPGVGGPSFGGVGGAGGGYLGGQTMGGANVASPGVRRRLPGGWGAALPQAGSLPTAAMQQVNPAMEGGGSGGYAPKPMASPMGMSRPMGSTGAGGWMRAPGVPGSISRGFSPMGGIPRPAAAPMGGPVGANSPAAGFDPANPFGSPLAGGSETEDFANFLMQQFGQGGAYGAGGSGGLMDIVRKKALEDANAGQQRAKTAAALYAGNDPTARGYANLASELNGQDGVSDALSNATLGRLGSQDDLAQWLLRSRIGADQNWRSNDQQALLGRIAAGEQRRGQGGGFGGWLANVGSNVASRFLP